MTEDPSILSLLEAERERYILEAASLERHLQHVRHQIVNLEALISGYATEVQMYSNQRHFSPLSSTQAILHGSYEDGENSDDEIDYTEQDTELESHSSSPIPVNESTVASAIEPDISDIPKLPTPRKPGTLPLVPEFQEYSVQNAILILMRRRPDLHLHIDAVVRDLYGDKLTQQQLKTATSNVGTVLANGVQRGLWYRVLRASGVYTLQYDKGVTSKQLMRR